MNQANNAEGCCLYPSVWMLLVVGAIKETVWAVTAATVILHSKEKKKKKTGTAAKAHKVYARFVKNGLNVWILF